MIQGRFFYPSEVETLQNCLNAVEDAWGVVISASVERVFFEQHSTAMVIKVACVHKIHCEELAGFAGTSTWLVSERLVPLQTQMIAAVQQFILELNQHMVL